LHTKPVICRNNISFFPDQYDTSSVQVTTSDIPTDFHTTFKPQIPAAILDSSSTTLSKQTEAVYNVKANSRPLEVISEGSMKSGITSEKNSSESVLPNEPGSTTLKISTVALHQNDEILNVPLIKILEELDTSTVADIEVDMHSPIQASTLATESSSWSSRKFHEVNVIKNSNNLTTLKGLTEITTLSLKDSLEETTVTHPTTSVAVLSGIIGVPSDINSTEKNSELSTILPIKFYKNIENKNLAQEIKLENSISHQVKNADISLKMGEEISISPKGSKSEYMKVKRHVAVEDQKGKKILKQVY
jgi:hypothetical protein